MQGSVPSALFLRNASILVLDEATESLDSQAKSEVQRAIDHLCENRTVICVAHRLSTLARATRLWCWWKE